MVGIVRAFLDLFEFQIVAALLAYFSNAGYTELKAPGFGVILHNLFAEAQHVKVKNMRVAAALTAAFREEVRQPQREITIADLRVVRPYRVIRHDEAALNNVNKVRHRISFQHVEQTADFERVVKVRAVPLAIVPVELPFGIVVLDEP